MRVLFVHNRYQDLGGEDLAAKVEMELVQQHGHTIDLFEVDNAEIAGFADTVRVALGAVYSPSARRRFADRIKAFRPDLVHIFNFFPRLSPSIHYACREARVPVVQKLSNFRLICPNALLMREGRVCEDCVGKLIPWPGVLHSCYRDSSAGTTVVATMLTAHRLLGTWEKAVDAYIARSNFSLAKLVEGGLPAQKIGIIPGFVSDQGDSNEGTGCFGLFAGRLSAEKGIATLLSALDRLQGLPLPLKVAGDGPMREEVTRRVDGNRVEYLGALPRQEVQALMRQAAFLLYPSVCYENFPLSIVEAFCAGLPVIASGIGAMAEIIEDGRTGLHFRAGDPEDLAAKIEWATSHPAEMKRMRREARAEYLLKYTARRNYQLHMELYERAMGTNVASVTQ